MNSPRSCDPIETVPRLTFGSRTTSWETLLYVSCAYFSSLCAETRLTDRSVWIGLGDVPLIVRHSASFRPQKLHFTISQNSKRPGRASVSGPANFSHTSAVCRLVSSSSSSLSLDPIYQSHSSLHVPLNRRWSQSLYTSYYWRILLFCCSTCVFLKALNVNPVLFLLLFCTQDCTYARSSVAEPLINTRSWWFPVSPLPPPLLLPPAFPKHAWKKQENDILWTADTRQTHICELRCFGSITLLW